jgi:hypothetical protein
MSSGNYMCQGDNSWPCNDVGSYFCPHWGCVSWATWQKTKYTTLLHKGTAAPDCTSGTYNPINFIVLKPYDWKQGHAVSIRIDGKDLDLGTLMHLPLTKSFIPFMRK